MPKTIILNQSTLHPKYSLVDAACRVTWGMEEHEHVKTFHYYGNVSSNGNIIEDIFDCVPLKEGICIDKFNRLVQNITDRVNVSATDKREDKRGERLIGALEYCLNNFEFDYIYRTSVTSYVDINKLYNYTHILSKEKVYNGPKYYLENEGWAMDPNWKSSFVASFNCIMSRDVVQTLVNNKDLFLNINAPEDIATGRVLVDNLKYANLKEQDTNQTWIGYGREIEMSQKEIIEYNSNPYVFNYKLGTDKIYILNYLKIHQLIKQHYA
jgi:hypothetical protein